MSDRVRPLVRAVVVLFVASVVGLATVEEDGASGSIVAAAAAATARTGSARMEVAGSVTVGGSTMATTIKGVVDFESGRCRLTTTMEGMGSFESVSDGNVAYLKAAGPPMAALAQGKAWIAVDRGAGGQQSAMVGSLGDPAASLGALANSDFLRDLDEEGTEEVRGVRTTRWSGRIDPDAFGKAVGGVLGPLAGSLQLEGLEVRLRAWISDDGLVRRSETKATGRRGSASFEATTTTELFDFGAPVEIAIPPEDQVHRLGASALR